MATYTVDPAQLAAAADSLYKQRDQAGKILSDLESIQLQRGDFGYIPGLGNQTWDAYSHHRQACIDSLKEMGESLERLARATLSTAHDYYNAEQQNKQHSQGIYQTMGG